MKKFGIAFLAILLVASMLLVGCANKEENPPAQTSGVADETTTAPESTTEDNTPVTVKRTYMPEAVFAELKNLFESKSASFKAYSTASAPYAIRDVMNISDGTLKSVTVPVFSTKAADGNGDFVLTMYVMNNSYAGLKSKPLREYKLKVNGAAAGLTANNDAVYRFVKIDLSGYDVTLSAEETVAFFNKTDTLLPAYLLKDDSHRNVALNLLKEKFAQTTGFFMKVGTTNMETSLSTLFYDFEFEKTYPNKAAYQAILDEETTYQNMVADLKEAYSGKRISIIGDSISTFNGVSNSTSYNSTIGNNAIWYPKNNSNLMSYTGTYWGRLIQDLGMELCVNNSWSGSRVYGVVDNNCKGNMLVRATELDNDNGTPKDPSDDINPDVILVYMGINDFHTGTPNDAKLYSDLTAAGADKKAVMENGISSVIATAEANGPTVVGGKTYTSWEAAYALSLRAMKEKYNNPELFCMLLVQTHNAKDTPEKIARQNTCIRAIAEYFGATVIDQQADGYVTYENCHAYGSDASALHPNPQGHALMERLIVDSMWKKKHA